MILACASHSRKNPIIVSRPRRSGKTMALRPVLSILLVLALPFPAFGQDDIAKALAEVDAALKDSTPTALETADKLLCQIARAEEKTLTQITAKLHDVRSRRLQLFAESAASESDWVAAQRQAENWLAVDPSLRDPVRTLWLRYGAAKLKADDFVTARKALNYLDEHFLQGDQADSLRRALRERSQALVQDAKKLPANQAIARMEEALILWPHAPGLRDDLEKLKKNYRVLYVAVRELPDNLSPATAFADSEVQSLDLLFRRLVQVHASDGGQRYSPDLIAGLPQMDGLSEQIQLRRDVYWSDGERLTSADVRHTAQLLESTTGSRELLDLPRAEGRPFNLQWTAKQGLLDPLAPLRLYILPEKYRSQPLERADNAEFAKAPLGNGPFQFAGRQQEGKRTVAVFRANPYFDRPDKINAVREIRLVAWRDLSAEQPLPQLVLDVSARSIADLKKTGYSSFHHQPSRRVYFLALNQRVPALANLDLRRALAHALQRDKVLDDVFRSPEVPAKLFQPLSGPFPAHSWAYCPPPRVPADIYLPDLAKSLARKAGQQLGAIRLTLKFPADEPEVQQACNAIAKQFAEVCEQVQAKITIEPLPVSAKQLRDALMQRDYDLAYCHWDFPDNNLWLWPLFDPHPDAVKPGGSNYLGYDNDAKLQSLLRGAIIHRQFSAVREYQQNIHVHLYDSMPLIPLWQIPDVYATLPSLTTPGIDPQQAFLNVVDWSLSAKD
jgi:peptide/nickel transport system substrate-binding protein